jgi:hypothetical protein
MKLDENTLIRYTVEDKNGEIVQTTFTLQQVEGSVPNFYQAFKDALRDLEDFDVDNSEIISREIVSDSDEEDL